MFVFFLCHWFARLLSDVFEFASNEHMLLYHFRRRWIIFHTYFATRKKREIYYYFCLLFRRVYIYFSSVLLSSLLFLVYIPYIYIHSTSFHILFLSVFRLTFRMLGMRMTIILLLVTCLLCCSFVHRAQFAFCLSSLVLFRNLHSLAITLPLPLLLLKTVKCRVYLTLS